MKKIEGYVNALCIVLEKAHTSNVINSNTFKAITKFRKEVLACAIHMSIT